MNNAINTKRGAAIDSPGFVRQKLDRKAVLALIELQKAQGAGAKVQLVTDSEIRSFAVRISPKAAATFCMVYSMGGVIRSYTIDKFRTGEKAEQDKDRGITAEQARSRALVLRARIEQGENIAEDKAAKRKAEKAEREARVTAAKVQRRKSEATLQGLLDAYVQHLQDAGKPSWKEVSRAFKRNFAKRRKLAETAAEDVRIEDVNTVLQALTKDGKYNEARKLNAYLQAAYTLARKARVDAGLHEFAAFKMPANPIAGLTVTKPKKAAEKAAAEAKARKWALTEAQLAAYWRRISAMQDERGALLRFHLLSGAQRVEQLSRLQEAEHDQDAKTITLFDTKGRRQTAREHLVPLLPEAEAALKAMRGKAGANLFTVSQGKYGAVYGTVRDAMLEVAQAMVAAGEIDRTFTPGIIRKTVETRLAAAGVSKEHRAHLQSHGLGGVQDEHYDAHSYIDEKRAALRKLRAMCEPKGKAGNVTPIRRKA